MNTETLDRLELEWSKIKSIGDHVQRFGGNEDAAEALIVDSVTIVLSELSELISIARRAADVEGMHAAVCRATKIASLRKDPGEVISRHILGDAA